MDDATQNISSTNRSFIVPIWFRHREVLTQALVRTGMVVILGILFENAVKMVFIQNQDMVEAFHAD